jgi:hypothetical protein
MLKDVDWLLIVSSLGCKEAAWTISVIEKDLIISWTERIMPDFLHACDKVTASMELPP